MKGMPFREIEDSPSWAAQKLETLRAVKLVVCLALGLLLMTPVAVISIADSLGGSSHVWLIVFATYAFQFLSLLAIGRRARRASEHRDDSPTPGEAQTALGSVYFLLPLAIICGVGWSREGKSLWAVGAAVTAVGLLAWLVRTMSQTRVPPQRP